MLKRRDSVKLNIATEIASISQRSARSRPGIFSGQAAATEKYDEFELVSLWNKIRSWAFHLPRLTIAAQSETVGPSSSTRHSFLLVDVHVGAATMSMFEWQGTTKHRPGRRRHLVRHSLTATAITVRSQRPQGCARRPQRSLEHHFQRSSISYPSSPPLYHQRMANLSSGTQKRPGERDPDYRNGSSAKRSRRESPAADWKDVYLKERDRDSDRDRDYDRRRRRDDDRRGSRRDYGRDYGRDRDGDRERYRDRDRERERDRDRDYRRRRSSRSRSRSTTVSRAQSAVPARAEEEKEEGE